MDLESLYRNYIFNKRGMERRRLSVNRFDELLQDFRKKRISSRKFEIYETRKILTIDKMSMMRGKM